MNNYQILKDKQQEEFNKFPMFFAFSKEQFEQGMQKFNLTSADTDKIYSMGGGGYFLKTDSKKLSDLIDKQDKEMNEAINSDKTGNGFIYEMFRYELVNHEYGYTQDIESTLDALSLTMEEINKNKSLLHGFEKAIASVMKSYQSGL